MAILARKTLTTVDILTEALLAAELGEPYATEKLRPEILRELFAAMPELHVAVPYAALKLVSRLASDGRTEVRAEAARALGWLVDAYPQRVEEQLLLLACDPSRRVRAAAAESLADLLPCANDPWELIETWNSHPDRAREVLRVARRSLPPPLGA